MTLTDHKSTILSDIYYDSSSHAGYASREKLWSEARSRDETITQSDVNEWLSGQLVYTLHRDVRRNFLRNRIIVSDIDEQWQADLVDMQEFKAKNNGNGYILTIVDLFSKYAWAIPIKNKGSKPVAAAFHKLFKTGGRIPNKLQTDRGTEFLNREVQSVFDEFDVHHFTAINPKTKCSAVERFNRTLKSKMFKFFTARGTRNYTKVLPSLIESYNNSVHRSTGKRPAWVRHNHKREIMLKMYGVLSKRELLKKHYASTKSRKMKKLNEGDTVRKIHELKQGFDKAYYPNWTDTNYRVAKVIQRYPKKVLKIEDEDGTPLQRLFYPEEVQRISPDGLYRVEKVINRRKTRDGKIEFLVKYLGYPASYNQWIPADNLQVLRNQ
ncbi:uncharacterized protein LOC141851639 [Brevipalpus obovatus]|uniref:uncharacterized protein LOC141851639 n=1 Tax=Brevipalpus obovatus TaxID=246614 RepID=UPI003D9DC4A4